MDVQLFKRFAKFFGNSESSDGAKQKSAAARSARSARYSPFVYTFREQTSLPFSGNRLFYYFLFALLFLALFLVYQLVSPFLNTIILGCIFSALCHPIYNKLLPLARGNGYVASALTLFLLVVVVCIPLVLFIVNLVPQASKSATAIASWLNSNHLDTILNYRVTPFLSWLKEEMPWLDMDVEDMRMSMLDLSRQAGRLIVGWGTGFVVDSLNVVGSFFLMLLIMFFLLKDGEGMVGSLKHLVPLREEQEDRIIQDLRRMARSVLVGGFLVAAIQGFVGGIGLFFVGIPAMFWGTVMAFAALVPVLGTGLVWVPAVIYLLAIGEVKSAIFLAAWCGILVTSIDSVLRPVIMRGTSKVSLLFLFMSVICGLKVFGMLGIVYGPLILSFVTVMLGIYSVEYKDSLRLHQFPGGGAAGAYNKNRRLIYPARSRRR